MKKVYCRHFYYLPERFNALMRIHIPNATIYETYYNTVCAVAETHPQE